MSPRVIESKLSSLTAILADLKPNVGASRGEQESAHYEIERQVQLSVELCVAIGRRLLTLRNLPVPDTNRAVFAALRDEKVISRALSDKLMLAAGLRNLLVHEYEGIDYDVFFSGLQDGFAALSQFAQRVRKLL